MDATNRYADTEHNKAKAIGGPLDGKELSSSDLAVKTINIPIRAADGWGQGSYKFEFGMWIWRG